MNPEQNSGQPGQLPPQNVNQPPVAPQPGTPGHNPYEFIMNPEKPAKKPVALAGNSLTQRLLIAGGGLVILIILVIVVASLITSGGKEKTTNFLAIAQEQTELVRIASDASTHVTSIPAQNLAQNVQASVASQNGELLAYLKKTGQKVSPAQLTLKHSKTTDATLTAAQENNTYDTAFKTVIQADLDTYMASLKKAYKLNPGPNGNALLSKQYDAAALLKTQSKQ